MQMMYLGDLQCLYFKNRDKLNRTTDEIALYSDGIEAEFHGNKIYSLNI